MVIPMVPVTLAALEGFFAIAFFLIAFIGWIVSLANQHQNPPKRGQGGAGDRQRRREVQGEIDEFLTQSRRNRPRQQRREEFVNEDEIEIIEPPKRRPARRPPPQGQQRSRTRREIWEEQTQGEDETASSRSRPPIPEQKPNRSRRSQPPQRTPSPSLGHLAQQVAQDVPHAVDQSVSSHMGLFGAAAMTGTRDASETTSRRSSPAVTVLPLLRSKEGIRNAVLLTEILSKPRGLQRRD
jgi:hypothetical protein